MKIETLLSSDALDSLHKKLGGGGGRLTSDDQQTKSLIQHREDHVWIWSTQGLIMQKKYQTFHTKVR